MIGYIINSSVKKKVMKTVMTNILILKQDHLLVKIKSINLERKQIVINMFKMIRIGKELI